ncbi:phosphonate C-P lyase system protein PhnG [Terrihabitans sp. B22-R8]|uniref:phosphonate C-P lyase system protein PhnG n=1 Tax=Terrihabitans sp. B22-R8 TaxID=3425128 RepID=UPI00403C989D
MTGECTKAGDSRQTAMALYAQATRAELEEAVTALGAGADVEEIRPPEFGLVMVRGRIGGTGAPFNVGEVSVTRAAVRLPSGEIGVSYLMGRDRARARAAAVLDALWQTPRRAELEAAFAPIRSRVDAEKARRRRQVAATKVDFFTMARGED